MKIYNFSAGPACLPEAVLQQAEQELVFYGNSGMSVMEMSHRSADYEEIHQKAKEDLRELLSVPDNYHVLFIQGGASMQFSMVPINLMTTHGRAYYINSGQFAKKAISEAKKVGEVIVSASSEDKTYSYIPKINKEMFSEPADYVHITQNNTIYGTRYTKLPDTNGLPIVTDMSSNILSEKINVRDYGLIYAGAQKNIGPAGVTVVLIRDDLVGKAPNNTPSMLDYSIYVKNDSMYNTPPTYGIYVSGLVFSYLLKNGGIAAMQAYNEKKAAMLYGYLDSSSLFKPTANKKDRSIMNVTFVTGDTELDKKFVAEAKSYGIVNIKGHRSVGGMRASIYNAMPIEGIEKLIEFMKDFEKKA